MLLVTAEYINDCSNLYIYEFAKSFGKQVCPKIEAIDQPLLSMWWGRGSSRIDFHGPNLLHQS
jgi:hypothetical protein